MDRKIYNKDDPSDIQTKIETQFFLEGQFDDKGNPIEISPLEFTGKKHFKFRGAIKISDIYIGSKISIQCKVYDGVVSLVSKERKRMTQLAPSMTGVKTNSSELLQENNNEYDDEVLDVLLDDE